MFPRELTTDRLRLEAVDEATDALELYDHCGVSAPDIDRITRYLSWEPHASPKESHDLLARWTDAFEAGEEATYVVRPREGTPGAGEFAGVTGLVPDWDRRLATLGLWLRPPFWGRGYSGERAHALMRVAFERLDLDTVVVTCHADNENSYRAIARYVEAAGGREEGLLRAFHRSPDGVADCYRFSVTAEEYAAALG